MSHKRRPYETWQHINWLQINNPAEEFAVIISKCPLDVPPQRLTHSLAQRPQCKGTRVEGSPDVVCLFPFVFQMWPPAVAGEQGLVQGHVAAGCQAGASGAKCCLASPVLSNLSVPKGSHSQTLGTPPAKVLCLQPLRVVPGADLDLFLSCVTIVTLAANTWRAEQLEGFRDKEFALCG